MNMKENMWVILCTQHHLLLSQFYRHPIFIKNYLETQPNPSTNPDATPEPPPPPPPTPTTMKINVSPPRPKLSLQLVNSNSSTFPVNMYPMTPKLSLQAVNSNESNITVNMHNTGLSMDVDFIKTGKLERYQSESIDGSKNKMEDQNGSNKQEHVELEVAKVAATGTLSIVIDDEEELIEQCVITPQYCDDTPLQQIPDPQYSVKQSSPVCPDIIHPADHEGTPSPLYRQSIESFEDWQSQSGELGERANETRALKGGNNDSYYGQEFSEY